MEFYENSQSPERALLIGVDTGEYNAEISMEELALLSETAGAEIIGTVIQKLEAPSPATYIGSGRMAEVAAFCRNNDIDLIIADSELTPSQINNIETKTDTRVVDRTMLILDIFAARARSSEGKLQVELAQLKYSLPFLSGRGKSMSRLGGGIGTRGPGESKLESDKRHIRRRIHSLSEELKRVEKRRDLIRSRRKKGRCNHRCHSRLHQCRKINSYEHSYKCGRAVGGQAFCYARPDCKEAYAAVKARGYAR